MLHEDSFEKQPLKMNAIGNSKSMPPRNPPDPMISQCFNLMPKKTNAKSKTPEAKNWKYSRTLVTLLRR